MCRIEYSDGPLAEIIQRKPVKARKDHVCHECHRVISKGEPYLYEFYYYDGRAFTHKTCEHCKVGREWLMNNCNGFIYGEVNDDIQEHAEEVSSFNKRMAIQLYRYSVGRRRKWRSFREGLLPVPVITEGYEGYA